MPTNKDLASRFFPDCAIKEILHRYSIRKQIFILLLFCLFCIYVYDYKCFPDHLISGNHLKNCELESTSFYNWIYQYVIDIIYILTFGV